MTDDSPPSPRGFDRGKPYEIDLPATRAGKSLDPGKKSGSAQREEPERDFPFVCLDKGLRRSLL